MRRSVAKPAITKRCGNRRNLSRGDSMSAAVKAAVAAALLAGTLSSPALANGNGHGRIDTRSGMKPDINDPAISGDFDYGVCRGTDPDCYHDWVGEERENRVLIYTRTAGPRHANLGP